MTQQDEWGPWIEHDGRGRPDLNGMVRQVEYADGVVITSTGPMRENPKRLYFGLTYLTSWDWSAPGRYIPAIRYRIKKPRGLTILEDIARTVDHRSPADTPGMDAFEGAR